MTISVLVSLRLPDECNHLVINGQPKPFAEISAAPKATKKLLTLSLSPMFGLRDRVSDSYSGVTGEIPL